MTPQQLGLRTMASKSGVPIMRLRKGLLDKNHWPALIKATGTMVELPIHFSFSTRDLVQLEQVITQMVERQGIELLIVDYLQRVQNASAKTREREVAEVSSLLKTMALTHNIAVLALCQLNRAIENRNDKTPTLSDLRDSGQIEADADVIIFLHRDDPQARSGPVDLIFAKGRNIGLGKVTLHWDGDKMTFHDNKGAEK
jgi:replicative DNA helicase